MGVPSAEKVGEAIFDKLKDEDLNFETHRSGERFGSGEEINCGLAGAIGAVEEIRAVSWLRRPEKELEKKVDSCDKYGWRKSKSGGTGAGEGG